MSKTFQSIQARRVRAGLGPVAMVLLGLILLLASSIAGAASDGPRVDVVRVDGAISPPMAQYIGDAIDEAAEAEAEAVVIELDTPGGLTTAMDEIIDDILASDIPVVVYVGPRGARAASAGVFITYAGHVAAMAPGTRIGSASPIFLGEGGDSDGNETLARKVTNDAVSQIKNLAEQRGRNAEWAEEAVREAVNITADEALDLNVIDLIADDVPSLLAEIDGRTVELAAGPVTLQTAGAETRSVEMGLFDQFLQLLSDPTIAYILLSLGSLGIFLELSNPGAFFPGVIGGLFLLLALYGLGTLPVNWAGVLLIAFAFLLFIVDLFVPSFGALTVGGVVSFVIGSYLLIGTDAPPGFSISPVVIWTMTALLVGFFVFIGASVLRARFRRPATGREGLIGETGTVRQALNPEGMVFLHGELWRASAEPLPGQDPGTASEIPAGTPVTVTAIDGLALVVRPATSGEVEVAGVAAPDARQAPTPAIASTPAEARSSG